MNVVQYYKAIILISVVLLMQGCFGTDEPNSLINEESDRIVQEYIEDNNIQATKSNLNYYYEPITQNPQGVDIESGDIVGLYYKISQLTGQHIDSLTASMGNPAIFVHVANRETVTVPSVANLGLTWMKEGETYRFYIPSYLAYGSYANDTLMPANANIKMDITVAFVTDSAGRANMEDQMILNYLTDQSISNYQLLDNGVYYYQISAGTGSAPTAGSFFELNYEGFFVENGNVFDEADSAVFQMGSNNQVRVSSGETISGFSKGIAEMVKGEKGVVLMPSAMAYGAAQNFLIFPRVISSSPSAIPPFAPLGFELELLE